MTEVKPDAATKCGAKSTFFEDADEVDGDNIGVEYDEREPLDEVPDLETSLKESVKLSDLFFSNRFEEALNGCEKWEKHSLVHSSSKSFFRFLYAMLTLEVPEIKLAKNQVKLTISLCQRKRKQSTVLENLSSFIWTQDLNDYTDEEAHAELFYADTQMMLTFLTFFGDQNLLSLVKGAFRMRTAKKGYTFCHEILKNRTSWSSDQSKREFESGVCAGVGVINLLISHLPPKTMKLLSLVGFHGDHSLAIAMLHNITDNLNDTIRYKVTELIVCNYNLVIEQVFGLGESDIEWVQKLVSDSLSKYPDAVLPLFFAGKVQQLKGNIDEAVTYFNQSLVAQEQWKQIHNICYWELCWCSSIKMDWVSAEKYARILRNHSNWSPATNMYQVACFLYMTMEETGNREMEDLVLKAMRTVPALKVRYSGKTIPAEKFAVCKATRYLEGDRDLTLPAFELFYIWNVFQCCAGSPSLLGPIQEKVEQKLKLCSENQEEKMDGYNLCLLLKGVCLRLSGYQMQAIDCFKQIIENEPKIKKDTFLPPQAALELGLTFLKTSNYVEARTWLEKARDDYSGFVAESLVHIRVHGALGQLKKHENRTEVVDLKDGEGSVFYSDPKNG